MDARIAPPMILHSFRPLRIRSTIFDVLQRFPPKNRETAPGCVAVRGKGVHDDCKRCPPAPVAESEQTFGERSVLNLMDVPGMLPAAAAEHPRAHRGSPRPGRRGRSPGAPRRPGGTGPRRDQVDATPPRRAARGGARPPAAVGSVPRPALGRGREAPGAAPRPRRRRSPRAGRARRSAIGPPEPHPRSAQARTGAARAVCRGGLATCFTGLPGSRGAPGRALVQARYRHRPGQAGRSRAGRSRPVLS